MFRSRHRQVTILLILEGIFGLGPRQVTAQQPKVPQQRNGQVIQEHTGFTDPGIDSTAAFETIQWFIEKNDSWKNTKDSMRNYLIRLLDHTRLPYDSIRVSLEKADFRSIPVSKELVLFRDSTKVAWLNDSTFVVDSIGWSRDLYLKTEPSLVYPVDFSSLAFNDSLLDENGMLDQELFTPDTVFKAVIDTAALASLGISMYTASAGEIRSYRADFRSRHRPYLTGDSTYLVVTDTLTLWVAGRDSPFGYLRSEHQLDSLHYAVRTLLELNLERDSTRIYINDLYGKRTPLWITNGSNRTTRFWVKNLRNDSITLWLGNPSPKEISLLLEDDINVDRMEKIEVSPLPVELKLPGRELKKMSSLESDPFYWDYEFSSALTFNQTYLSHWTKGGESSLTTMIDMTGGATYNNKEANTQWINSARIKFGTLISGEKGFRKNNDQVEVDSKFNRNASGKIGMSASFYMKNQIARGYNYPNDSVVVSKFMNPATMTIGLGAEYKPYKHTNINVAPLSYRATWVLDTAQVDQTKHGIDKDKRAKQELGTQVVIINKFSPLEDLVFTNRLRLFSNYLNHPQNVDVDWEVIVDSKISWFFTVRLNLHLVYDDDVRFDVLDAEDQPVLQLDGQPKSVARTQFKEFVGLSLLFKF